MRSVGLLCAACAALVACTTTPSDPKPLDPGVGAWKAIAAAPEGRTFARAVWTGTEMLVWGGEGQDPTDTALRYDPATDTWSRSSTAPIPARDAQSVVAVGGRMLVLGGFGDVEGGVRDAALYEPATDEWRRLPEAPIGIEVAPVVWSGRDRVYVFARPNLVLELIVDRESDRWKRLPRAPLDYVEHMVMANDRLVLISGHDLVSFDPDTRRWRRLAKPPLEDGGNRTVGSVAFGDGGLYLWGGATGKAAEFPHSDGAVYAPSRIGEPEAPTTGWFTLPAWPLKPRGGAFATWAGENLLVFGGGPRFVTGAILSTEQERWLPMRRAPLDLGNEHVIVWTGQNLIVWDADVNDGAIYDPDAERPLSGPTGELVLLPGDAPAITAAMFSGGGEPRWIFPHEFMPEQADDLAGTRDRRLERFGFETAYQLVYDDFSAFDEGGPPGFAQLRSLALAFGDEGGASEALGWLRGQVLLLGKAEVPWQVTYYALNDSDAAPETIDTNVGDESWGVRSAAGGSTIVTAWRTGRTVMILGAWGNPTAVTPEQMAELAASVNARA